MLTEHAAQILARAFAKLLGQPEPGSMAFIRCLPPAVSTALAAHMHFDVPGWRVAAVVDNPDPQTRRIAADQAVEWREAKGPATLLLVDTTRAGAGMDGIYGATREIGETELFDLATELARQQLPRGYKGFAQKALAKAGWGTRRRPLAPWSALEYLCRACEDADQVGAALPVIGLWPVATEGAPDASDLDKSLLLAERLLPAQGSRLAPEQRAAALRLGDGDTARETALARLLRQVDPLPRHEALAHVAESPDLWLNRMKPGVFDDQSLQGIEWVPWRGKTGKPAAWSGLIPTEDDRLEWRLSLNPEDRATRARLEVRWKADPDDLAKGAAEYQVVVRSDSDVLAEKAVSHTGRSPQKVVFTQDDFDDLDESSRFEVEVCIRALGDHPCEAVSEGFVLCFGEPQAVAKSSAGRVYATLSLAVAHLTPDSETFKELARRPGNRSIFSKDKKGYIACRWAGKVGRVFCPKLIGDLGQNWIDREGALGRWRLRVRADGTPLGEPEFVPVASGPGTERLAQQSRQLAIWMAGSQGPLGVLHHHEIDPLNKYVLAASEAWQQGAPELTLIDTLEVVCQAGRTLGLIVLPMHPLRVAWQQGYDLLVAYHRYDQSVPATKIDTLLARITGAHYPSLLPGVEPGQAFVFADTLGPHAVALVRTDDPEPKATVALLGRLLGGDESTAPSVGKGAADALGGEIHRYLQLHPHYRRVRVHALRAGDAMPVARALGQALKADGEAQDNPEDGDSHLCFELGNYSPSPRCSFTKLGLSA